MIAEYMNMITTSVIMSTLFFGGYRLPFGFLSDVVWLGPFVLIVKVLILLFVFVWVRASMGRPRYDQLMGFSWKFLLPVSSGLYDYHGVVDRIFQIVVIALFAA